MLYNAVQAVKHFIHMCIKFGILTLFSRKKQLCAILEYTVEYSPKERGWMNGTMYQARGAKICRTLHALWTKWHPLTRSRDALEHINIGYQKPTVWGNITFGALHYYHNDLEWRSALLLCLFIVGVEHAHRETNEWKHTNNKSDLPIFDDVRVVVNIVDAYFRIWVSLIEKKKECCQSMKLFCMKEYERFERVSHDS